MCYNRALPDLSERAKTLVDLIAGAGFIVANRPIVPDEAAAALLDPAGRELLGDLAGVLEAVPDWSKLACEAAVRAFAEQRGVKLGKVAQPMRAALTGRTASPGIFDVLAILGPDESLGRLRDQARIPAA